MHLFLPEIKLFSWVSKGVKHFQMFKLMRVSAARILLHVRQILCECNSYKYNT